MQCIASAAGMMDSCSTTICICINSAADVGSSGPDVCACTAAGLDSSGTFVFKPLLLTEGIISSKSTLLIIHL